jgi:hypothetical protein
MLLRMLGWYLVIFSFSQIALIWAWFEGKVEWGLWAILAPMEITLAIVSLGAVLMILASIPDYFNPEKPWVIRCSQDDSLYWNEFTGWTGRRADATHYKEPFCEDEVFPLFGFWYLTGEYENERQGDA